MPVYTYVCEANDETVQVLHPMATSIATWGELCGAAEIAAGKTDPNAPVKRQVSRIQISTNGKAASHGAGSCCGIAGCG